MQVNEKGQLRLSRKALLPEPAVEDPSGKATDKDNPKRTEVATKRQIEQLNDNTSAAESPKSNKVENTPVSQKVSKKIVYSARNESNTNKDRSKKGSNKVDSGIGISTNDGTTMVNGEAKIG